MVAYCQKCGAYPQNSGGNCLCLSQHYIEIEGLNWCDQTERSTDEREIKIRYLQQRLATVEAVSRNRLETILLLHDCYRDACSEADSILSDLRKLEAERDRLTDRIKELEDALAEEIGLSTRLKANLLSLLRAIEVKEIDDLMTKNEEHFKKLGEVIKDSIVEKIMEINRLTKLGEERHIRAKDTEEGLMEHVERLQDECDRLKKENDEFRKNVDSSIRDINWYNYLKPR